MSTTTAPLVTVILTAERGGDALSRCLVSLRDQSLTEWHCVCLDRGDGAAAAQARAWSIGDDRVEVMHLSGSSVSAARNAALERARGQSIHYLEAEHSLFPGGLSALLAAAQSSRWGAAIGGVERIGTRGESLAPPEQRHAGHVGLRELRAGIRPCAPAMLIRRATLGEHRFDATIGEAAELDLWLRLAERGVRWERCPQAVARQRIGPPASMVEAKTVLSKHLSAIASSRARLESQDECGKALAPMLMALLTLRLASEGEGDSDALARSLLSVRPDADLSAVASAALSGVETRGAVAAMSSSAVLEQVGAGPALWWRRWGFCGAPPRAIGDVARDRLAAIIGSVERVPARVIESCEPGREIVLLGMGKNARKIARLLARRGVAVIGRDDGLSAPPAWAAEESIDVRLLGAKESYSPEAQHIMTVLDDEAYLRRLPSGLRIVRWSRALRAIEEERDQWLARWPAA